MDKCNIIRKNGWSDAGMKPFDKERGDFKCEHNYWYAVGVHFLQQKEINDLKSWWFFAAIHGEYVSPENKIDTPPHMIWENLEYICNKNVLDPLPDKTIQEKYWSQCQHASSFFAPWHRGYLVSLELALKEIIIAKGGPEDWGLPYWDIVANKNVPFDFTENVKLYIDGELLRDCNGESYNPLYVKQRFTNENYDPVERPLDNNCLTVNVYTHPDKLTPDFGGKHQGFQHFGQYAGALEKNPHNNGHIYIGGSRVVGELKIEGLMSDPYTAGLDPIFYLHHCNIDRLWASWNAAGNENPKERIWLDGPSVTGERQFIMPHPERWIFTPRDVKDIDNINIEGAPYCYNYDHFEIVENNNDEIDMSLNEKSGNVPTLLVATENIHLFDGKEFHPNFVINTKAILEAAGSHDNNRYFILLEGVKGNFNDNSVNVYVGNELIESLALFGLAAATKDTSHHGGSGLSFNIEITKLLRSSIDIKNILSSVRIELGDDLYGKSLSIDRISIYKS